MKVSKQQWDTIYTQKNADEVSWTQQHPTITMQFINEINLPKNAKIIDVGGGEGFLVDVLLDAGYTDITILDISEVAIKKAKIRLAEKSNSIKWIVADVTEFKTNDTFDFWHDRAVFHFLTEQSDIDKYRNNLTDILNKKGFFLLGTFSPIGPYKCSGLNIVQYSKYEMGALFNDGFLMVKSYEHNHLTPFNTIQNFQYGGFQKIII